MPSNERKRKELLKIGTSKNQSKINFAKKSKKEETAVSCNVNLFKNIFGLDLLRKISIKTYHVRILGFMNAHIIFRVL